MLQNLLISVLCLNRITGKKQIFFHLPSLLIDSDIFTLALFLFDVNFSEDVLLLAF